MSQSSRYAPAYNIGMGKKRKKKNKQKKGKKKNKQKKGKKKK